MYQLDQSQLNQYVNQFEARTLPKDEWTHEVHLIIGLYIICRYKKLPLSQMRKRIIQYNQTVGTINSDTSGYNETITAFWLTAVKNFCQNLTNGYDFDEPTVDEIIFSPELTNRNLFLEYYSKDLILSTKARKNLIPPNLKPFPNSSSFNTPLSKHLSGF